MKITFVSNFFNHHQLPFCSELLKRCDEFYFIVTEPVPEDRTKFGYEDLNTKYDFILRTYDDSMQESRLYELLEESDVVIFGSCPNEYIDYRMKFNKLSFLYSERFLKKGVWRRHIPTTRRKIHDRIVKHKDKELYVLCASSFLSWDLQLCGFNPDKCFRWGYFPQVNEYAERPQRNNDPVRILWAGRMLPLKHAETAVEAVSQLKARGLGFTLDFVGMGECEKALKKQVRQLGLDKEVRFLGSMTPKKVIENMEQSDVFLMTSNFREGWGAVINEAMSTGCAVVTSSAVGCAPYLIKDGENGLVYKFTDNKDFADKLAKVVGDKEYMNKLGENAFKTLHEQWCVHIAAERFIEFVSSKDKAAFSYESGPMSKAPVIKNDWYK